MKKKVIYVKSYHVITFSRVTTPPILKNENMSCHVTKININKQPNWQNLIALFNENLKAFETINGYLYNSAHLR